MKNNQKLHHFGGKKEIPAVVKEATSKKLINLVCKDIRPFEIITGQGFKEFAQEMINIDATYGTVSVDNLLPHPTTLSRNVVKKAESVKNDLSLKLKFIFEMTGGAFTTDMWTDDYRKVSYISLTVHYIDENWQINEQVLAASKFSDISNFIHLFIRHYKHFKNSMTRIQQLDLQRKSTESRKIVGRKFIQLSNELYNDCDNFGMRFSLFSDCVREV